MAAKSYKALLREAKRTESYWVEALKVDIAASLAKLAAQQQITKVDLAAKLGTSKAYITKVFRGDTNFTIETLVKIAGAVDARVVVDLVPGAKREGAQPTPAPRAKQGLPIIVAGQGVQQKRARYSVSSPGERKARGQR